MRQPMGKRATIAFGLFLLLLFVGGAVLIPAHHMAHCGDHAAAGGDTDCSICQVGNNPSIAGMSPHVFDRACPNACVFKIISLVAVLPPLDSSSQPRAPPAAC